MALNKKDMRNLACRFTGEFLKKNVSYEVFVRSKLDKMSISETDQQSIIDMLPLVRVTLEQERTMKYG